jgi:signal transduction histidine kinase
MNDPPPGSAGELAQQLEDARRENHRLEALLSQTERTLGEAEQSLQQAQKMETLGTLVAGVAHEINNPINLILYNLPLMERVWSDFMPVLMSLEAEDPGRRFGGLNYGFLRENLTQLVTDMKMAAHRVAKIVTDLKNFSRQSSVADKSPVKLNTAVRNALRLAQPTLRGAGVRVRMELGEDEDLPEIDANLQNIEQITLNIVVNAVQAIDQPDGEIIIQTGFTHKDGRVFLKVSDNGRGVAPELAERIFLPFVTDKQAQGGTGLGLSVSYSLVKAHHGEIVHEKRQGGGTTFSVFLPTRLRRQAAKILVVDDDDAVRRILLEALAIPHCYLLEAAGNGIEASIRLGTYRPDLLILDVFMPEMDGLEVCRHIKSEPALAGMKVIITTGFPGHAKLDELAALGFGHVLAKPFDIPKLLHTVHAVLAER